MIYGTLCITVLLSLSLHCISFLKYFFLGAVFRVTSDELHLLSNKTSRIAEDPTGYITTLSVFHNLHCLVRFHESLSTCCPHDLIGPTRTTWEKTCIQTTMEWSTISEIRQSTNIRSTALTCLDRRTCACPIRRQESGSGTRDRSKPWSPGM